MHFLLIYCRHTRTQNKWYSFSAFSLWVVEVLCSTWNHLSRIYSTNCEQTVQEYLIRYFFTGTDSFRERTNRICVPLSIVEQLRALYPSGLSGIDSRGDLPTGKCQRWVPAFSFSGTLESVNCILDLTTDLLWLNAFTALGMSLAQPLIASVSSKPSSIANPAP